MELLNYCNTDSQRALVKTWYENECKSKATAIALGKNENTVRGRLSVIKSLAAKQGYSPEHDMTHMVPDGFGLKGVSTYYDKDGKARGQWVKSVIDRDRQIEIFKTAVDELTRDLPKVEPREADENYIKKLMTCYPIGDGHIGLLSWPDETGEDWNIDIATDAHLVAMANLVEASPATEEATIINLGDWLHYDNVAGITSRSGNVLDTDGRYAKMAQASVLIMRQMIEIALEKHKKVRVINVIGNHDDVGALWLSIALNNRYEKEPRVTVDMNPSVFSYFRHGKCLVGLHHGHSCKIDKLPGVMAADMPRDWGETLFRFWWTGHVHHSQIKEFAGVTVESFRTLAAKDAFLTAGGYRAMRDMHAIILHEDEGIKQRNIYTITEK